MKEINEQKISEFVDNNKDALLLLERKIRDADSLKGITTIKELLARKHAISIVQSWLSEIWDIKLRELPKIEEEEPLYRIVKND